MYRHVLSHLDTMQQLYVSGAQSPLHGLSPSNLSNAVRQRSSPTPTDCNAGSTKAVVGRSNAEGKSKSTSVCLGLFHEATLQG